MAFLRSSLADLRAQSRANIRSRLSLGPLLARSVLGVLADTVAAAVHHLYGFLDFIAKQALPDTAEAADLDRHAELWLDSARTAAAFAAGSVSINATIGTSIPAGTRWKRGDGELYELVGIGVVTTTDPQILPIQAVTAGLSGNADDLTALTVASPVSGLQAAATASGALVGGTDRESDDALRSRVLTRMRLVPQGGAEADYILWSLSIATVTRAWVVPEHDGGGTVLIYIATDDAAGAPIPAAGTVTAVQAYIDTVRPVTADPTVAAPTAAPMDPNITLTPDTPEVRAAVELSMNDYLRRESAPGGTLFLSQIREAISVAAGETNHVLVSPAADVTHTAAQLATLGTVTWS